MESSIIIKTCGTTTPLHCLAHFWKLIKEFTGSGGLEYLEYSHVNFQRPELQAQAYQQFETEVSLIADFLGGDKGISRCFGNPKNSCWYLYTYQPPPTPIEREKDIFRRMEMRENGTDEPSRTIQLMMTDLDHNKMRVFIKPVSKTGEEATRKAKIEGLLPGMQITEELFDPCGYSMNGIAKDGSGTYMTIHVTPEKDFSFVSFETNAVLQDEGAYNRLISKVAKCFRPKNMTVTFCANLASGGSFAHKELDGLSFVWKNLVRDESQFLRMRQYDVTFATYEKVELPAWLKP